jgi:hypothetical protein
VGLAEDVAAAQLPSLRLRRSIRLRAGASLRDMASEMGRRGCPVSAMAVLHWERGTSEPKREHAIAYRQLLDDLQAAAR